MRRAWVYAVLSSCAGASIAFSGGALADPDRAYRGDGAKMQVERGPGEARGDRKAEGNVVVERRADRDRGDFRQERRAVAGVEIEKRRDRNWRRSDDHDRIIRRSHRYLWGPGVAFYFSDGYYYGECSWLKRRAIETGSRIWWRRYERCRDFS
jgi:hypothetical protein